MSPDPVVPPRLLPDRSFPAYAYLPGPLPHPVRDPAGHSYLAEPETAALEGALESDTFRWGIDLFNHGYYWEAHEAWEALWQVARPSSDHRRFLKALILLAATGVKIREGKSVPALPHARRAAALLHQVARDPGAQFEAALGMAPTALAGHAEDAVGSASPDSHHASPGSPEAVFGFVLAPTIPDRGAL